MSYRFVYSFRAGPGWNSISILVLLKSCIQNKFVKTVHLVVFIIKKFVTMHGHMKLKFVL